MDKGLDKLLGMEPDQEQLAAITASMGVNVVLAGPGAGKSTVIVCRILYLACVEKVNTRDITVLVFNRDAKESLSKRVKDACDRLNLLPPEICTIHSKCYGILRGNMSEVPQIEETDIGWYRENTKSLVGGNAAKDGDYIRLWTTMDRIRENGLDPETVEDPVFGNMAKVIEQLEQQKDRIKRYTFQDMSQKALDILVKGYHKKIPHLLVDEAQDITEMQFRIIRSLMDSDLFLVGDSDQCIYGFRYASSRYIDNPEEYFYKCNKYYIGTNYRSTEQVVNLATAFVNYVMPEIDRPRLRAVSGKAGPLPEIRSVSRQADQFRLILDLLKHKNHNLCVIYRNNISGIALANFLLSRGVIPAHLGGEARFFQTPVIRDIMTRVKRYVFGRGMGETTHPEQVVRNIVFSEELLPKKAKWASDEALEKTNFYREYALLLEIAESCETCDAFLQRVADIEGVMTEESRENGDLVIATAHSVKGLEFSTVVIIDLVQGVFPGISNSKIEEARLMYVAMTRASNQLILLWPDKIRDNQCRKSEFLEIIEKILKQDKGGLK